MIVSSFVPIAFGVCLVALGLSAQLYAEGVMGPPVARILPLDGYLIYKRSKTS